MSFEDYFKNEHISHYALVSTDVFGNPTQINLYSVNGLIAEKCYTYDSSGTVIQTVETKFLHPGLIAYVVAWVYQKQRSETMQKMITNA
jgi:hypothetical protein